MRRPSPTAPSRPKRVLVVYQHLPHYRYDVFRRLEELPGFEVEFAAASESQDGSIPTIPASALQRFHPLHNLWFGPLLWQIGLLQLIVRQRPDVVVFLGVCTYLSSWIGAIVTRAQGGAALHWTIGWHRPERGAKRLFRLTFYRLASKLLIYGHVGQEIGVAMGYPRERMRVIYNSSSEPVEAVPAQPTRTREFIAALPPPGLQLVCAVIRLNPVKRLDLLVQAAAALRAQGRPVQLLLVGEGPERPALSALAERMGVPIWMPGPAYGDEELGEVYRRSLLTVVPSAAGLTVLQSLKFGRPVITHDNMYEQVPECEAIVPGVTGDLYSYGDLPSLQKSMAHWLDRQLDDPETTAHACRQALEAAWNADAQARLIEEELHEATSCRNGSTNGHDSRHKKALL